MIFLIFLFFCSNVGYVLKIHMIKIMVDRIPPPCGYFMEVLLHLQIWNTYATWNEPKGLAHIHWFILLACAECDDSLPFSRFLYIPPCYIPFHSTVFHQLVFYPPSLHLAICFLVCLSASLFPNTYTIFLGGILFSSTLRTCPNQDNRFNLIGSVIVGFF